MIKNFKTIQCDEKGDVYQITMNRAENQNSMNETLIDELLFVLNQLEENEQYKVILIKGNESYFCTGLDLADAANKIINQETDSNVLLSKKYMELIKTLSCLPKIVVSQVNGVVLGGGMGIIAVSDLVVASTKSRFGLPEALWGLLPACVAPYLIRKIGFQNTYKMALMSHTFSSADAKQIGLIDEIAEDPQRVIEKYLHRLRLLKFNTIKNLKNYFRQIWIVNEAMENIAINTASEIIKDKQVQSAILQYIREDKLPWT